jgi:hypothetical protein
MQPQTYTFGSRLLLAGGPRTPLCFGSDLLDGHGSCALPEDATNATLENELMNTVGAMLTAAFKWARSTGVKTCVGTEAPLAHPPNAASGATTTELYEGIFRRIAALGMPLDYYWIWTSEGWGARGSPVPMTDPLVQDVLNDFLAADAAKTAGGCCPTRDCVCACVCVRACACVCAHLSPTSYATTTPPPPHTHA